MGVARPLLLSEQLRRHATHRRDKLALLDEGGAVSFGELSEAIDAFAAALRARGVKADDRVGFALAPSSAHAAAILGCVASGAIACFLNIRLTSAELAAFLEPIAPALIVCDPQHEAIVSGLGVPVVVLKAASAVGSLSERLAPMRATPSERITLEEDATALIVPTGGTTGVPKGAMLSQRALWLWCSSMGAQKIRRMDDLELYYAPFFHVSLVTYCFCALFYGGALRITPRFSAELALELIGEGVTHLNGAPTTFSAMRRSPLFAGTDRSRIRDVGFGAMAATPEFIAQIRSDYPNARLRHAYGSTEVGTATLFPHEEFLAGRVTGVGRPNPGVRISVVDDALTPLPAGEIGEIVVDAPWIMSGYWGREKETRETVTELGVRTGDLGWIAEDGWVTISGRKKEMIISGGENIFPNEVESVLASHPDVAEVCVYGVADPHWGERVECAVVPRSGSTLDLESLTTFARRSLAGYKLPKRLKVTGAIPMTPANKPDRRRLRELAEADMELAG